MIQQKPGPKVTKTAKGGAKTAAKKLAVSNIAIPDIEMTKTEAVTPTEMPNTNYGGVFQTPGIGFRDPFMNYPQVPDHLMRSLMK
jgi:hypothetical protein